MKEILLPKWYTKWVPRVSTIVSFVYPFIWTEYEKCYLQWLSKHNIDEKEYIDKACSVWTFIHKCLEDKLNSIVTNKKTLLYTKYKKTITNWIDYINTLQKKYKNDTFISEPFIIDKNKRYQWSVDLVREDKKNKQVFIYDYKTWWIARADYWLKNKYSKPYSKLKKVSLQMSLYCETYRQKWWTIWWIYAVWLRKDKYVEYKLDIIETKELDTILKNFNNSQTLHFNINDNKDMYEIEILEPTKIYWNIKVKVDMNKVTNWKTPEEILIWAIKLAKYIANEMKDKETKG